MTRETPSREELIAEIALLRRQLQAGSATQSLIDRTVQAILHEQQSVFNAVSFGVVVMQDRTMRRCNRVMERLFDYGPGQLDEASTELLHPDPVRWARLTDDIRTTMRAGKVYHDECQMRRRDGSLFWVRRVGSALVPGDPLQGTVWVYEDITEKRAAAESLRRASELTERATRIRSEFLATVSHEIGTPMNAILGMTHLALQTELTPAQQDYLASIQRSAQDLRGILDNILDISRLKSGKLSLDARPFALEDLLRRMQLQMADKAVARGLELKCRYAADLPRYVMGDPDRLLQMLLNYVDNAIRFTERGQVQVSVARQPRDDVRLRFEVRDTGIGVPAQRQGELFQEFVQLDGSATRKHGGTGLSLALTKALAGLMGGEVGMTSSAEGSVFWFTARLAPTPAPAHAASAPPPASAQALSGAGATTVTATADPDLSDLLARFTSLLADDDAGAVSLLARHRAQLCGALGPVFAQVEAAVSAYDYDLARAALASRPSGTASR